MLWPLNLFLGDSRLRSGTEHATDDCKGYWIQKKKRFPPILFRGQRCWGLLTRCDPRRFFSQRFAGFDVLRVGLEQLRGCARGKPPLHAAIRNPRFLSLDARSRMDGFLALQVGECGAETISRKSAQGDLEHQRRGRQDSARVNAQIHCHVPTNIPYSSSPAQLCTFEDNAAVTHMISKGRSPNLRHATGLRSVDFHCVLQRINMDRTISITYVQLTDQIAASAQQTSLLGSWDICAHVFSCCQKVCIATATNRWLEHQPKFFLGGPNALRGAKQRSWS